MKRQPRYILTPEQPINALWLLGTAGWLRAVAATTTSDTFQAIAMVLGLAATIWFVTTMIRHRNHPVIDFGRRVGTHSQEDQ